MCPPSKTATTATTSSGCPIHKPIPGLTIVSATALLIGGLTLVPIFVAGKLPNVLGMSLLVFNNINIFIAISEILLGKHILFIQQDYRQLKKEYEGKERQAIGRYLFRPLSLLDLVWTGGEKFATMWSTYALWDPSYQNHESFGFFIDVGNGWSTIPPNLLWNAAIVFPSLVQDSYEYAWLVVGFVGCCSYWQVLYGTVIYLFSFLFNKRWVGKPVGEVVGFVYCINLVWFFFPLGALYASAIMLRDQNLDIFQ